MVGVVDAVLPALQRLAVHLLVLERIAEHADGRDGDVAIADRIEAALAEFGEVLAIGGLPEERLEALEAEIGDLARCARRALPSVALIMVPMRMDLAGLVTVMILKLQLSTRWRVLALSMAANTMARLLMLSLLDRLGRARRSRWRRGNRR